jgi:hypothetical protein
MSTISKFSSRFSGGVRPNLFVCNIVPPKGVSLGQDFSFHCKATSMPASSVPAIDVNYRGRQLKVPGDRTYADWTATVYNDVNMSIRHTFEGWMHLIQNHGVNQHSKGFNDPYGTGTVTQIGRNGKAVSSYFMQILPTEVAAIDLAWDSNDAVEEYTVTFAVNYWVTKNVGINDAVKGEDSVKWHISGSENGIDDAGVTITL